MAVASSGDLVQCPVSSVQDVWLNDSIKGWSPARLHGRGGVGGLLTNYIPLLRAQAGHYDD